MRRILFLLLAPSILFSQEILSDLHSNPILLGSKSQPILPKTSLVLPFIDDFSYNSSLVSVDLWEQSSVFVNRTYPIDPPTIGVATFDGLDKYGLARDFSQLNPSVPSDTLLSRNIDLSALSSVYFMFYFQAKGIGDVPEINDSLVLEFQNDTLGWEQIWFSNLDTAMLEFEKVVEIIDEPRFLHSDFRFRFRNYATVSGNFDHWHLDYVKLDLFLSSLDTSVLNDVSFVYNSPSFLQRYAEMPWNHFLNNETSELKDSIDILIRNNDAGINVDYQYNVFESNILLETFPNTATGWRNYSIQDFNIIGNFSHDPAIMIDYSTFNSSQSDSVTFCIQNVIQTSNTDNKQNDTLYHMQDFYSHFSYDDGTAESAYGINVNGAKLAYEFNLNRPDTLRAIQMYFPQMLDSVNHIPFYLTIWSDISGAGSIIYQQEVTPKHTENGSFHTYYLDSLFQLSGVFYVGWIQSTDDLLNIGLDKNNVSNQYMYYDVGAGWNTSSYPGSWMIRPVVSENKIISNVLDFKSSFNIYPNPAVNSVMIESSNNQDQIFIYNMQGVLLKKKISSNFITNLDISDLSPSMYIVELLNEKDKKSQILIVQ